MAEDQVTALFDAVPEPVVLVEYVDGEPLVRDANDTFGRVFGLDTDAVRGDPINEHILPEDDRCRERAREIDARAAAGEAVEETVTRMAADGEREFLFRTKPFGGDGTVECMTSYVDVTDRTRERERFQALVENASDIVTVLDADGTIRYESPAVERILGYDQEELVGENAYDYVHPDDVEAVRSEYGRALDEPDRKPKVEYRFRAADGEWRVLESIASNRLDSPVEGFVVNSRDVTERKRREQRLEWYRAYVQYHQRKQELSEQQVELNVLEAELGEGERAESEEYERLRSEIDDLRVEVQRLESELAELAERYEDVPDVENPPTELSR
jgi:PAS domain S-box-containing protein